MLVRREMARGLVSVRIKTHVTPTGLQPTLTVSPVVSARPRALPLGWRMRPCWRRGLSPVGSWLAWSVGWERWLRQTLKGDVAAAAGHAAAAQRRAYQKEWQGSLKELSPSCPLIRVRRGDNVHAVVRTTGATL